METRIDIPTGDRPDPEAASAEVRRVTWVMLAGNLLLTAAKCGAGVVGGSQAVVADGLHSLTDTVTDVAVLIGARYWGKPADAGHPHGHRRIESLVTLFIGAALVAAAVGLAWRALAGLAGEEHPPPGWLPFYAALGSLVSKEWMYRWCLRAGARLRSPALTANAWHHRSDAWSSVPAALAVLGARLHPDLGFLDPVGAVGVSLLIVQAAWEVLRPALDELADRSASSRVRERIVEIATGVDGVRRVHAVRTRRLGGHLAVDLHVLVDGDLTVRAGHEIAETVCDRLRTLGPDVVDVVPPLDPEDLPAPAGPADAE